MSYSINGYPIDVVKQYRPKYSSKTTDHPVEKGADFTDNVQANPFEFTMDCVISNNPEGPLAQDATRQGTQPAKDAWNALIAIYDARQPVSVVVPDGSYTNMVMVNLERTMDAAARGGLLFTCSFKKIVIVTNNRTTVRTAIAGGGGQDHKGDRQAITLDPSSTWVISYPSGEPYLSRASKIYGPPIVKGKDGGNSGVQGINKQGNPITVYTGYDRYKVDPLKVSPDGYVDNKGVYTPYVFDPPDGKFHPAPSLFNGPNDNPLNMPRDVGNSRIEKPNNIQDYLKNAPKNPPKSSTSNQPQVAQPGSLASLVKGS